MIERCSSLLVAALAGVLIGAAPRLARARGCTDATHVVGYTRCSRFGDGIDASSRPPVVFNFSTTLGTLDLPSLTLSGGVDAMAGRHFAFTLPASQGGTNTAWVAGVQVDPRWFIRPWWYVGFSVGFGMASVQGGWNTLSSVQVDLGDLYVLRGGLVTGVALSLGPVLLRAEVMAGGRTTWMMPTALVGEATRFIDVGRWDWVVAPRLAIDVFVQPTISVSLMAASEVVPNPNVMVGLGIGLHARSFDGTRDR